MPDFVMLQLVPLSAMSGYLLLLIWLFIRRGRGETLAGLFSAFLGLSALWLLLWFLFPLSIPTSFLPSLTLLASTFVLGLATHRFLDRPVGKWLLLGTLLVGGIAGVHFFWPLRLYVNWLPELVLLPDTLAGLLSIPAWALMCVSLVLVTRRHYRGSRFPSHANRVLYWGVALSIVLIGDVLVHFQLGPVSLAGQVVRLLGAAALAYAVITYRLFDIRSRLRRGTSMLISAVFSALPFAILLLFVLQSTGQLSAGQVTILGLAVGLGAFLLYPTFRRLTDRMLRRLLFTERLDTVQIVRDYSQAIASTLDVAELALVIVGTMDRLLGASDGDLLLASQQEAGLSLEPVTTATSATDTQYFPAASRFIEALSGYRHPLLQYELDFNPDFRDLDAAERNWLGERSVEVYVPIFESGQLAGIIALGPKSSGLTYRPDEMELLQTLANQTVVALRNARLYSALGQQNEQIRDLNDDLRRQNERLEVMDKAKADFISIASHELRTPLTQVKGYADILAAMSDENMLTREQTREIVKHIERATRQLENLVAAMLDASQIDVNSMQLTFTPTKLETVLRLAIDPLSLAMRERRLRKQFIGVSEAPMIQADFRRIVQAFQNVIGNAIKYTPDGGEITISAQVIPGFDDEAESYLEVVIADEGIGLDARFHELIFEKFFRVGDPQLHSTGSTKFKGAGPGLGLPIARGVIEAHGGRIWVESEGEDEDRCPGSRFHILLPIATDEARLQPDEPVQERPAWLMG